ncbi:MAG: leucyl/phenylalanyl-tRNA--protein transferase [Pseudobdellovibrio sp.]|nr:leucyl/phenylalanyl-tRNA--protein transferase [Pseudobdellovibrio sp.]
MSVLNDFPDPQDADIIDGVIAVGGLLDAPNLKLSYSLGIFPWPHEGYPLLWFCPDERGILEFSELNINKSLAKWIRKHEPLIKVTVNQAFAQVIQECQKQVRAGQKGSWITPEIIDAYTDLSKQGGALSVECWLDDELISGIYGVRSKNYFSCESMFFKKNNASKYAFVRLVQYLKSQGLTWMDLQMVTDVSESFGGKYISRDEFLDRI